MQIYRSYAKVNIFLKITGTRDNYHELISRFMIVDNLYDEMSFVKKESKEFEIIGDFSCSVEQNTIYKSYIALRKYLSSSNALDDLVNTYAIKVLKNIPAFAGLGGGSSNAATFLKMCNEKLNLNLSKTTLANIGAKVGADVAFFVYEYKSANVSGVGEIVEEFAEDSLKFHIFTPKVEISTPKVYKTYRKDFFNPIDAKETLRLKKLSSKECLETISIDKLNDLYSPALQEYKELKQHYKNDFFFSGSGSSFFSVV